MKGLLLVVVFVAGVCATFDYTNTQVVRTYLKNEKQIAQVNTWEVDVWSRDSVVGIGWNVVNSTHLEELRKLSAPFEVLIGDVEKHLEEGARDVEESRKNSALLADFFTTYHTYDEYAAYLTNITTTYSSIAKTVQVGTSLQGRNIFGITVTGTSGSDKTKIFISGGQHAREWIAPATTVYIITQLVTLYGSNSAVTALLNAVEFHFVPMVNPDGYVYSWSSSAARLWRKNRRLNAGGSYGVDLNRNWDDHWGGAGSSGTPTSDTYRGTGPFSEPETTAVSRYVDANGPFSGAIDYHCYSQLILRPYGWTSAYPPNEALAKQVGDTIRARILAVHNVPYVSQPSWQLYYTTGSAQDWYYGEANVPLSYTIELRDTGRYGFVLPANQIVPTGAENWAGFVYFAEAVVANTK